MFRVPCLESICSLTHCTASSYPFSYRATKSKNGNKGPKKGKGKDKPKGFGMIVRSSGIETNFDCDGEDWYVFLNNFNAVMAFVLLSTDIMFIHISSQLFVRIESPQRSRRAMQPQPWFRRLCVWTCVHPNQE